MEKFHMETPNKRIGYLSKIILVNILLSAICTAGTGKIAGKISSSDSALPLPGVNVIIDELSIGAATDLQGNYVILNIPAGEYTLKISAIGYQNLRVTNLAVKTGQTTREDYKLDIEVIEGQEVVVVAERRMVQKDLTATQKITTSEEIKELPVETFLGVLTTQAGVNVGADGALHIRGGRSNEVGYYIDGISVASPFSTNGLAVNISNKALQEMKVVSGAFNAEYGNAMSGIVNIQIKEGGDSYKGSVTVRTGDYYSANDQIFMNIDDVNIGTNKTIDWTLNGPVPLLTRPGKLTFNISGRYSDSEGYFYGKREHLPDDRSNFLIADSWQIELGGDNKIVPMSPSKRLNTLGKLTYRFSPKLKVSLQLIDDKREWKSYVHSYKYNPDGTYTYYRDNANYSVKLNQSFGKSYYTLNVYRTRTDYKYYVYEDPTDERYVSTNNIIGSPGTAAFVFGGTQMGHLEQDAISDGVKFDFSSQLNHRHEMKLGFSTRNDQLESDAFTILYNNQDYPLPTVLPANESPYHNYYNEEATFYSAYIQDKIEYPNMIINVGLRTDYFNPNTDYIADLLRPEIDTLYQTASIKQTYSPRFGISFPITDEGILHFSYGHFYQLPSLANLYRTSSFGANLAPTVGNGDMMPEKTVLYEFGLQQQLTRVLAFEGSVFYKDIRNLLATQSIKYDSPSYGPSSYAIYMNKDYGTVKGIALSLTKRWDKKTRTSAFLDYSYQITEGNDVSSGSFYFNALTGEEEEKKIVPLGWDQSHVLNATVTISDPRNWAVSMIGAMSTGWPYTPTIPYANYIPDTYSSRKPFQRNINLRVSKNFKLNHLDLTLLVQVYNLFDLLNERYVYDDTGNAGYTFINRESQETEIYKSHYGEPGVHTWEEYQTRPQYYRAPRSLQLGMTVEF